MAPTRVRAGLRTEGVHNPLLGGTLISPCSTSPNPCSPNLLLPGERGRWTTGDPTLKLSPLGGIQLIPPAMAGLPHPIRRNATEMRAPGRQVAPCHRGRGLASTPCRLHIPPTWEDRAPSLHPAATATLLHQALEVLLLLLAELRPLWQPSPASAGAELTAGRWNWGRGS